MVNFLSFYLIFIVVLSILAGFIILRFRVALLKSFIFLLIAIFVPALAGYIYFTSFTAIPETIVPDLSGIPLEEAFHKLEEADLSGRYAGSVFDMNFPEGQVVSQRPEAGKRVKIHRAVFVLTSSGKRRVLVPNLLGRPAIQAKAVLAAKGLLLGEVRKDYVSELDPGIILIQQPLPDEEIDVGSSIDVTVSSTEESKDKDKDKDKDKRKDEGGFRLWW